MIDLASHATKYDCSLLMEATSEVELRDLDAQLPSDTYLTSYHDRNGKHFVSAFRAFKSVDIFDALHDAGFTVKEIKFGFGRIKPRLYNAQSDA